jgi:phage protein U
LRHASRYIHGRYWTGDKLMIDRIIQGAHDRRLCFLTLKHEYKIDFYDGKYCIVRLSGNHANILSRGSKREAIFALERLNKKEKLV